MKIGKNGVRIGMAVCLAGLLLLLAAVGIVKACGLNFRQHFRWTVEILMGADLICLIFLARKRIEQKKKARIVTGVLAGLLTGIVCCAVGMGIFLDTDRESAVTAGGRKKLKVESSFLMSYEVAYYDYGNAFWYRAFPCVRESYDDGNPDDLVYTDYYDEDGALAERVFPEGKEG